MLNKLVTSPFISGSETCHDIFISQNLEPFENLLYFAISNTAYQILIPRCDLEAFEINPNEFTALLRNKIKVIDSNKKIFKKTKKLVIELIGHDNDPDRDLFRLHYANIFDFIYKTMLGCKYDAEIDVQFLNDLPYSIKDLIKHSEDKDCKILLSEIVGIFNLYESDQRIASLKMHKNISEHQTIKKITELFDDLNMHLLSTERHNIGIHRNVKKFYYSTKSLITNISKSQRYKSTIKLGKQLLKVSPNILPIPEKLPDFSDIYNETYSPPLICLDEYRNEIVIKQLCGDFPLTPLDLTIIEELGEPYF